MKKPLFVAMMVVGVVMLAGARSSSAQDPVLAHVPFPFMVNGRAMPAGDYRVIRDTNLGDHLMQIISRDGRSETFTVYDDTGIDYTSATPSFQFKKLGAEYVLWRVNVPGESVYEIPFNPRLAAEAKYAKAAAEKGHKGNE